MYPTLDHNEIVAVYPKEVYGLNDVIAFKQGQKLYVKRITAVDGNRLWVESDNQDIPTVDSNVFGWISTNSVIGVVQCERIV